jgi:ABC-type multidrug transport system fused ATPase/permease subunit
LAEADAGTKVARETLPGSLRAFYRALPHRRRRQVWLVIAMMLAGALAEMVTIGAVLPFVALLSDPARAAHLPGFGIFLAVTGGGAEAGGNLVARATGLLIATVILSAGARLLIYRMTHHFVFGVAHDIGTTIFARMLRQPYHLHISSNSGTMLAGIDKVQTLISGMLLPLMHGIAASVIALAITALLTAIAPVAAAAAAVATLAYLAVSTLLAGRLRANSQAIAGLASARMQTVQEGLGAIRDILLDHSQEIFEEKFSRVDRAYRAAQASVTFAGAAPRFVLEAVGIVLIGLLALKMSTEPGGIAAALPVLGALALGAQRLLPLLNQAYFGWTQTSGNLHSLRDLLLLMKAETVTAERVRDPKVFAADIVLDRVSLRRPGGEYSLRDINLTIRKGERIGIVGRTGSGKTSLLDILMGLIAPTTGEIRVDGRPLDHAGLPNWQAQIAHVPQHIFLADNSIAANIAFACAEQDIDMARVREAARLAQVDRFIEALPMGYATGAGDRGASLSGGQRQRIALARAYYKRANILILDEATGHLDRETEDAVMRELREIGRDITILIVAHQASALTACDRVVQLEEGRLAAPPGAPGEPRARVSRTAHAVSGDATELPLG